MVLSIGMIVKNEEEYLERCLTALQPLLSEVDSELIIADTGSTDRTVEIAKKFTDNVFHFDWINDFSAARNATLEKASGEWFMFIDADEIAVDCTDIIRFFRTRECDKYKSAVYIQRSFTTPGGEAYTDFRPLRMAKRTANTTFLSAVHEYLFPVYAPTKYLNFVVLHYGYAFTDENGATELARQKSKRNLDILFEELESGKLDRERETDIYSQIADCYAIIDDWENTMKYLDMGLKKGDHSLVQVVPYYTHKIKLLHNGEKFKEVTELSDEYFDVSKNPFHNKDFAADCFIRAVECFAHYKLQNYGRAINASSKFITLYGKFQKGKLNTPDLLCDVWRLTDSLVKTAFDIFFFCCFKEKQFALANDYVKAIPLEKYLNDRRFMENHINIRVEMMENLGYNKLDELYRQLDDFGKEHLLSSVRIRAFKAAPEKRAVIVKKLAALGGKPSDLAQIYRAHFDDDNVDFELVKSFLEKYGSEKSEDMLLILMAQNLDITPFLRTSDFFADRAVQLSLVNYEVPMKVFEDYDINAVSDEGLALAASLYGWVLLRSIDRNFKVARVFEKYAALGVRWYEEFQSDKIPDEIRAALLVNDVVMAHADRDLPLFRKKVYELKNVVPDLIPIANAYYSEVEDDFANVVSSEFAQLAFQVKQNIRNLIRAGNIKDARAILGELSELCPNDPDIEVIKKEINNTLQ